MADMTLEQAMKLADQDCPLPSLAGPALKLLRAELQAVWAHRPMAPIMGPECSRAGCDLGGWMPCADRLCPKNASSKDC